MKHGKKLISALLALVLLCGLLPIAEPIHAHAATADECPSGGDHDWIIYENPATCTWAGMREEQCTKCYATRNYVELPPLGHNFSRWATTKEATCTEAGSRTAQCANGCGESRTESIPALGHSWDGGVTANGVTTYTCTRCGESYTEAAAPTPAPTAVPATSAPEAASTPAPTAAPTPTPEPELAPEELEEEQRMSFPSLADAPVSELFNLLRNVPPTAADGDLVITQQPTGGSIPANGSFTLTTAVEGGVAPYTYEWHRVSNLDVPEGVLQAAADKFVSSYNNNKTGFAAAFHEAYEKQNRYEAVAVPMISTFSYGSAMYHQGLQPVSYDLNDRNLGQSDSPEYPATAPGTYYCVIRDSAGHWVSTEDVEVTRALYIVTQPQNANINGQSTVTLICVAAGGTPYTNTESPYIYAWRTEDGKDVGSYDSTVEISEPGRYYCIVQDDAGTTVTSDVAEVFDAESLWISCENKYFSIEPGVETEDILMHFGGGYGSLTCEWDLDGKTLESHPANGSYDWLSADTLGTYTFTIRDEAGQIESQSVQVFDHRLHIVEHTLSAEIEEYGTAQLSITVSGGQKPYRYEWTWTDIKGELHLLDITLESYEEVNTVRAEMPGVYSCTVVETQHHVPDTPFAVQDYDVTDHIPVTTTDGIIILEQPEDHTVPIGESTVYAKLSCDAVSEDTGNDSSLQYRWEIESDGGWTEISHAKTCVVNRLGYYRCVVTDARTEKRKVSDIVSVTREIVYNGGGYSGTMFGGSCSFNFTGGTPPYRVELYSRLPYDVPGNKYEYSFMDILVGEYTQDTLDNGIVWFGHTYYTFLSYHYEPPKILSFAQEYYAVVTDSLGARCESELVGYGRR